MAKEVALQVAMRCRPFSEDNAKLGVMCSEMAVCTIHVHINIT